MFDCVNCKDCKGFEGTWFKKDVSLFNTVILPCGKSETTEIKQDILLDIKKISDEIYLAQFNNLLIPNNTAFNCVATQSTENPNLIQSGTNGLNSFYFKNKIYNVLHVNYTYNLTENINILVSASFELDRIKI
jgi:hypothetical protein